MNTAGFLAAVCAKLRLRTKFNSAASATCRDEYGPRFSPSRVEKNHSPPTLKNRPLRNGMWPLSPRRFLSIGKDTSLRSRKLSILSSLVFVGLFTTSAIAAATRLEIIELQNREAAALLPVVKPLLSPQTTLVADGYRLIVKGTPADIAQLKSLVASLDTRLRNLLIDVRTVRRTVLENSRSSGRVTIGNESSVRIEASRASTRARDTNGFQVRTIEGREAFVQVGQQRPEDRGVIRIAGGRVVALGGTTERNARSGVYVTARVRGEQVLLDIAPGQQRFSSDHTRRSVSSHTTLTARLGEWVDVASVDTVSSGDARGAAGSQRRSGTEGYVTQVKVTLLD